MQRDYIKVSLLKSCKKIPWQSLHIFLESRHLVIYSINKNIKLSNFLFFYSWYWVLQYMHRMVSNRSAATTCAPMWCNPRVLLLARHEWVRKINVSYFNVKVRSRRDCWNIFNICIFLYSLQIIKIIIIKIQHISLKSSLSTTSFKTHSKLWTS